VVEDHHDMTTGEGARIEPRTIDFHAHVLEPHVFARTLPNSVFGAFGAHPEAARSEPGSRMAVAHERMLDPEKRLADMDERGVDVQVLSSIMVMQYTAWADPPLQLELEARVNDAIAALCVTYPERFVGSFTLPLRDVGLSLGETERAVRELDLRVVNLPAGVDGAYLGAPQFRPLWEAFRDLGVVAFVHPDGVRDPWFQEYALWNSLGQSIEESKVMASLILEGVLEDMPELQIVIAHGGGFLPHNFGRLDRNFRNRPGTASNISKPPSEYLRSFYLDTCVYDPAVLAVLLERVGPDRLLLGTDYPVGDVDPLEIVRRAGASENELAAIAGGNAARLLGL
jgi:aminocarboxymuconate-semialdehyde decarboxylase